MTGGDEMAAGTGAEAGTEAAVPVGRRARVVLVDDHRMFRTGVLSRLNRRSYLLMMMLQR